MVMLAPLSHGLITITLFSCKVISILSASVSSLVIFEFALFWTVPKSSPLTLVVVWEADHSTIKLLHNSDLDCSVKSAPKRFHYLSHPSENKIYLCDQTLLWNFFTFRYFFLQMDILDGRDVIVDFDDIYGRPGRILRS